MKRLSQKEYKEFTEFHKGESRCTIFIANDFQFLLEEDIQNINFIGG